MSKNLRDGQLAGAAAGVIDQPPVVAKLSFLNSYAEFIAGYIAASTSISIMFPLNKLIFRQILNGTSFREAFAELKNEGLMKAYRGLLPPLLQKSTSYSIMFGSQSKYYQIIKTYFNNQSNIELVKSISPATRKQIYYSLSGAFAGLTEAVLTPFERVQAVLQMPKYHDNYKNTYHVFRDLQKNEGFKELYRGLTAICLRNSLSSAAFFTGRRPLKQMFPQSANKLKNTFYDFLSGGLLGAILSTVFYPFNVIKSHMQARVGGPFIGMYMAYRLVYESRNKKFVNIFKGVGSNFTRAILGWGITNSAYEFCLFRFQNSNSLDD